ncbi:MAG: efflux RND transporter periplasmic adaptor subunit [Isosphaeraceae bacterium]|nr:efflux RND transporter periplasmic adaptor subunit [Isosphaeraceae bacterium]
MTKTIRAAVWALGIAAVTAGCEPANTYVPPPPPVVTVTLPVQRAVTSYVTFTGTTKAVQSVDLRARVKGFLESINFTPAEDVEKGKLLFTIDPKPFQAKVDQAAADLANKEAQFANADSEYKRANSLHQRKVISEEEYIQKKSSRDAAKGAVDSAKATLDSAQLDLGYCRITAPISGRISRNLVDVQNLVGDGQATVLATIVQEDPIYTYFTVSEVDLLRFRSAVSGGTRGDFRKVKIPLEMGLADETGYPHEGRVDYADPTVDPSTGTVIARGIFDNPDKKIVPGLFVRIRTPFEEKKDSLLVPERALASDQAGRYVLVVKADDTVERRGVKPGTVEDGLVVIEEGLKADDRVIVDGLQKALPGAKVNPKPIEEKPAKTSVEPPAEKAETKADTKNAQKP